MNNRENEIVKKINGLAKGGGLDTLKTANPFLAEQIEGLSEEDISVGECAKFVKGHFEGNLRTDGHKWVGDTKYTRTLNFDFTTGEITFVSDENRADFATVEKTANKNGLQRYAQAEAVFTKIELVGKEYFNINDKMRALKRNLYALCNAEHHKVGFWFESLDVLQYTFIPHENKETELYPIYVLLKDKKGNSYKTFIGWYSEADGKPKTELLLNELQSTVVYKKTKIVTAAEKRKKTAKWVIGILCAVAVVAVVIVSVVVFPKL